MLTEGTSLTVGTHHVTVARYLSEGGFSKIYEVTMDPAESGTEIGCLKQVIVPDKNGLNTLRKEVDVMKTLRKARSIVKYYDSNAERLPDGSYQVLVLMELCPNNSLLEYMNEKIRLKLSEPEILKIMLDISIGVYEMHKIKLIHRDIKIENVLIGAKNDFKLCDFGSVSTPIRPPQHQQEFQLLGHDILYHTTPQYRSPEMIDLYRGYPIDERSDIWALGCFLYKLCYYITPFEANGDIAILHASFQFPPEPVYSGDLKNLIIIMLQENPLYRPNIVQILMLVAKLMKTDYKKLDLEDFYGAGEYNFQALHEMQLEKQNQLLKQQQYYLEQQKQQQAYELSKQKLANSKSSLRSSPLHLSRQNSVHVKGDETPVSSIKNDHENPVKGSTVTAADAHVTHITTNSKADVVSVQPKNANQPPLTKETSREISPDSSPDELDLDVELPELEHIAERYPSLDDLDNTNVEDGSASGEATSHYMGRSSFDNTGYGSALESVDSRDISALRHVESGKSATDLELVDAWQKDATPKFDEKTEKLADEIFSAGTAIPQRTKSTTSTTSAKSARSAKSGKSVTNLTDLQTFSEASRPQTPKVTAHSTQSADTSFDSVQTQVEPLSHTKAATNMIFQEKRGVDFAGDETHSSLFSDDRTVKETELGIPTASRKQYGILNVRKSIPEPKRGGSNPWGNALSGSNYGSPDKNPHESDLNLSKHMGNLKLGSSGEASAQTVTEANLIDLSGISIPENNHIKADQTRPASYSGASDAKAVQNEVSNSLMDMHGSGHSGIKYEDPKPLFKKKLADTPTQTLNFQEQVIDFASDDENQNSEMSRVAIRNSLRKSRKHSDHRRSDSSHSESKKRLSFFGSSD